MIITTANVSSFMMDLENIQMKECREVERGNQVKLSDANDEIMQLKAIQASRDGVLAEKEIALSSMRSKLYNDYLVMRTIKEEKNFAEEKMDIIMEENYRITKIISEMSAINVGFIY